MLQKIGISSMADAYPNELSGGEQQRVAVARAIITSPKILFADEPTGALDEKNEAILLTLLLRLKREGTTILIATHSNEVKKICDRVWYLDRGRLLE